MAETLYAALAIVPCLLWFMYHQLYQWRFKKFAYIPSTLKNNLFFGHLPYMAAEYKKAGNATMHPDYVLERIWKQNGCPEFLYVDTRPAQMPLVLIASHEMAEQISRSSKPQPYSVTKSPTVQINFRRLVGKHSLLSEDGESWKALRKTFNPGFAPMHLLTLLPVIIDKTYIFMEKLDALAKSGIATEMESFCTNVTFDIIGAVVMDVNCRAQDETKSEDDIVRNFRMLSGTWAGDDGLLFARLNVLRQSKRWLYCSRLDATVKKCIEEKFAKIKQAQSTETKGSKDRSVLALALRDTEKLTPDVLQSITDQVKTFLFAGHDTTSILLQRLFYILSIHPQCLAKIRAEHESIFGDKDVKEVFLARPDETMKRLVYTSACIKEALRLWPPAGSARMSHNGFKVRTEQGEEVCLDKTVLYLCQHIIQRDPKVYGETADEFVPERWVGDVNTSATTEDEEGSRTGSSKIPISAWRPFERGPRNCIGQELANIEARVILACVMRRYDFVKVGLGEVETDEKGNPIVDGKGRYKTKSELLSTMSITAKPMDKTVMRVKFAA